MGTDLNDGDKEEMTSLRVGFEMGRNGLKGENLTLQPVRVSKSCWRVYRIAS